ncbi:hypothetical protein ES703_51574 [subsurface metagenome]
MTNKADWRAWNDERQRYLVLDSQGFDTDIASLERHISKLQEVAPKDKAGWITLNALELITKLKGDVAKAKTWARMV